MCNGILFNPKQDEILPFVTTWTDLEYYAKGSKSDGKDRNHVISLIWDIKHKPTNKKKQTHRERQLNGGYQRRRGVGEDNEGKGAQIYGDKRRLDFGWWE